MAMRPELVPRLSRGKGAPRRLGELAETTRSVRYWLYESGSLFLLCACLGQEWAKYGSNRVQQWVISFQKFPRIGTFQGVRRETVKKKIPAPRSPSHGARASTPRLRSFACRSGVPVVLDFAPPHVARSEKLDRTSDCPKAQEFVALLWITARRYVAPGRIGCRRAGMGPRSGPS